MKWENHGKNHGKTMGKTASVPRVSPPHTHHDYFNINSSSAPIAQHHVDMASSVWTRRGGSTLSQNFNYCPLDSPMSAVSQRKYSMCPCKCRDWSRRGTGVGRGSIYSEDRVVPCMTPNFISMGCTAVSFITHV